VKRTIEGAKRREKEKKKKEKKNVGSNTPSSAIKFASFVSRKTKKTKNKIHNPMKDAIGYHGTDTDSGRYVFLERIKGTSMSERHSSTLSPGSLENSYH